MTIDEIKPGVVFSYEFLGIPYFYKILSIENERLEIFCYGRKDLSRKDLIIFNGLNEFMKNCREYRATIEITI